MNIGEQESGSSFAQFTDRRNNTRFPVKEEIRYKLLQGAKLPPILGVGETLNIGSGGLLFTTQHRLPLGRTVELSVNWPARLDGTCPLQFVAQGKVVRSEAGKAAVRIEKYEFKTRRAEPVDQGAGAGC